LSEARHGTALDALNALLAELRKLDGMIEKKRGVFYRKSQAFLHFHEDPAWFFADVRSGLAGVSDTDGWQRLPVNNARERQALVAAVRKALGGK